MLRVLLLVSALAFPVWACDQTFTGSHVFPEGVTIPAGERWCFDPQADTAWDVTGNVIVEGILDWHPARASVQHTLRFVGVDETTFVGGDTSVPLETDPGLWVMGEGVLDLECTPKRAWKRERNDASWRTGDVLRVAPIAPGQYGAGGFAAFVAGSPLPQETLVDGTVLKAEVLNLTRNCVIAGAGDGSAFPERNGRAHVFLRSTQPQTLRFVAVRQMGPRQYTGESNYTAGVPGRYPLHFHRMGEGARGSLIEGVVVETGGHHAFVTHASHGVTYLDTIAYDVLDTAYWWDPPPAHFDATNNSHDITYHRAVAAYVRAHPVSRGFRVSGFALMPGINNAVTFSVAVGIQGFPDASGFLWPEVRQQRDPQMIWTFRHNTVHNSASHGIFTWQNDQQAPHNIDNSLLARNGAYGISHGAYVNNGYHYRGGRILENALGGIFLHAQSNALSPGATSFEGVRFAGAGPFFVGTKHQFAGTTPVRITDCAGVPPFRLRLEEARNSGSQPGQYDFIRCAIAPADVDIVSALPGMRLRVQRRDGTAWQMDHTGAWENIPAFEE